MVTITPEITGKWKDWNVQLGDQVKAGQIMGKQDISQLDDAQDKLNIATQQYANAAGPAQAQGAANCR